MKQEAGPIVTFCAALSLTCIAFSGEPVTAAPVVGHEFKDISVPGISGIFWTRREDHFTLQFQFCTSAVSGFNSHLAGSCTAARPPESPYPDVRVQLRDRNGAEISHLRRLAVGGTKPVPVVRGAADGVARAEVVYVYHLGDGERAEAITVRIDGREFVEKVPRLSGN